MHSPPKAFPASADLWVVVQNVKQVNWHILNFLSGSPHSWFHIAVVINDLGLKQARSGLEWSYSDLFAFKIQIYIHEINSTLAKRTQKNILLNSSTLEVLLLQRWVNLLLLYRTT